MSIQTVTWGSVSANSGGSASLTPGYPASPQADDLLLVYAYSRAASVTFGLSGWSTYKSTSTANGTYAIFYKAAAGGESGTVTVTSNAPTNGSQLARMIRVPGGSTTLTDGAAETEAAGSPITNAGVTAGTAGSLIVLLSGKGDGGNGTTDDYAGWAGNSLTWNGQANGTTAGTDAAIGLGTALKSGTGATGNLTATNTLNFVGISYSFAIVPTAAPNPTTDIVGSTSGVTPSGVSIIVTTPANQSNDIIVVVGGANDAAGAGVLSVEDTGSNSYTQIQGDSNANRVFNVWWRRSTGTSTPSVTVALNETNRISAGIVVVRGCTTSGSPFDAVGTATDGTSQSTKTMSGITTSAADALIMALGMNGGGTYRANNFSSPLTETLYNEDSRYVYWGMQSSAGASGDKTHTWDDAAAHTGRAMLVAMKPQSGGDAEIETALASEAQAAKGSFVAGEVESALASEIEASRVGGVAGQLEAALASEIEGAQLVLPAGEAESALAADIQSQNLKTGADEAETALASEAESSVLAAALGQDESALASDVYSATVSGTGNLYSHGEEEDALASESEAANVTVVTGEAESALASETEASQIRIPAAEVEVSLAAEAEFAKLSSVSGQAEAALGADALSAYQSFATSEVEAALAADNYAATISGAANVYDQGEAESALAGDGYAVSVRMAAAQMESTLASDADTASVGYRAGQSESALALDVDAVAAILQAGEMEAGLASDADAYGLVIGAAQDEGALASDGASASMQMVGYQRETAKASDTSERSGASPAAPPVKKPWRPWWNRGAKFTPHGGSLW